MESGSTRRGGGTGCWSESERGAEIVTGTRLSPFELRTPEYGAALDPAQ